MLMIEIVTLVGAVAVWIWLSLVTHDVHRPTRHEPRPSLPHRIALGSVMLLRDCVVTLLRLIKNVFRSVRRTNDRL